MTKKTVVCWSGGKDCCLALHRLLKEGQNVVCLLAMVAEKDARNRAHGIPLEMLKMQADALEIPLLMVDSGDDYEMALEKALCQLKDEQGVEAVAFGSLYVEADRKWNETIAFRSGLEPLFPAWITSDQSSRLLGEFLSLGYRAVVCRASEKYFNPTWVGRPLDREFFDDIQDADVCVMGEYGEYHTFVLDGPIFRKSVEILQSEVVLNSGLWSLDILQCRLVG
ncbi:MAG TPA: diphthine--ammonia ligase [Bacillales bacterium]|nr:diphthine--ammonia ligase [Bacillales bacterium]